MKLRNLVLAAVLGVSACEQKTPAEEPQNPREIAVSTLNGMLPMNRQRELCAKNPGAVITVQDHYAHPKQIIMCEIPQPK